MYNKPAARFVIDTNVLFEGLTKQGGASGLLIDAWLDGLFVACVTDSLAYEYADVLSRKLSVARWMRLQPVLATLLSKAEQIAIYFRWRPASPDPGDEHVIDCAVTANAVVVTWNVKDFQPARTSLGISVLTPVEAVILLADM